MNYEIADQDLMGENVKAKLKKCGEGVKIYPLAKLAFPHVIELGNHCKIRDFRFYICREGCDHW